MYLKTWSLNKNEDKRLAVFERSLLRIICGLIFENGEWRKRCNKEQYKM